VGRGTCGGGNSGLCKGHSPDLSVFLSRSHQAHKETYKGLKNWLC
jgi:hypothetical protein